MKKTRERWKSVIGVLWEKPLNKSLVYFGKS